MSTSRERVLRALNHQTPDRVPLDLGATNVSGIAASSVYGLRRALGLPEKPVKVHELFLRPVIVALYHNSDTGQRSCNQ